MFRHAEARVAEQLALAAEPFSRNQSSAWETVSTCHRQ